MWYGYMRQKAAKELITLQLLIMPLAYLTYNVKNIFMRREQRLLDKSNSYSKGFAQFCVAVSIPVFPNDVILSSIPKRSFRKLDLFSLQR